MLWTAAESSQIILAVPSSLARIRCESESRPRSPVVAAQLICELAKYTTSLDELTTRLDLDWHWMAATYDLAPRRTTDLDQGGCPKTDETAVEVARDARCEATKLVCLWNLDVLHLVRWFGCLHII
jgi:hypothetical protein